MASRLEQWLARLDAARDGEASQRLTLCQEALAKAPGAAVARAAGFLRQQECPGWEHLAVDAFERLGVDGAKVDPGCLGRLALAEALLEVEWPQSEPWWSGLQTVQWEAVWGGRVDAAAALRGRCALGFVRCGDPRGAVALAALLADAEPECRQGAVRALREAPELWALPLLAHRAVADVESMDLQLDLFQGLLERDNDSAFQLVATALRLGRPETREAAAIALGEQGAAPGALLLWALLDEAVLPHARRAAWLGLALSRCAEGRQALLAHLKDAPRALRHEAAEALEGLRDKELEALLER